MNPFSNPLPGVDAVSTNPFMGVFKTSDGGFINLTAEYRDRRETNRAGPDLLRVDPPRVTQRIGDAAGLNVHTGLTVGDDGLGIGRGLPQKTSPGYLLQY